MLNQIFKLVQLFLIQMLYFHCRLSMRNKIDICEDAEIRERIEQLKSEQESKRLAEAQRRRVRRSQSNNTRYVLHTTINQSESDISIWHMICVYEFWPPQKNCSVE